MLRIKPKADLIYGASKTRKTSNIGLIALYILEKYGKRTRLITLDGGGYDPIISLVNEGIVIPWYPLARPKFTISTIDLACQGYWPLDPDDPNSPLRPPADNIWKEIGFIAIEGLTSLGDCIIRQLKADKAHLSQDPSYSYNEQAVDMEGGGKKVLTYSGGNMSYFGAAQDMIYDFVTKTHMLPCEKVLWTGLEGKGEEEGTKLPSYGPAIVGKKSTGKAPQWFGNCVHIEQLVTQEMDDKTKQMRVIERPVMYLRTHADPTSRIPFPCGTRAPFQFASELPEYLDPPDMGELYRRLDILTTKMDEVVRAKMKDISAKFNIAESNHAEVIGDNKKVETGAGAASNQVVQPVAAPSINPSIPTQVAALPAIATLVPPKIMVKKPS